MPPLPPPSTDLTLPCLVGGHPAQPGGVRGGAQMPYQVEITMDGKSVATKAFKVQ